MALNPMLPVSMVMGQSVSAGRLDDPKGEYQIKCLQPGRTGPTATGGDISMEGLVCFFFEPLEFRSRKVGQQTAPRSWFATVHGQFLSVGIKGVGNGDHENPKRICC